MSTSSTSRRDFLKKAALGLAGGVIVYRFLPGLGARPALAEGNVPTASLITHGPDHPYYGFAVNTRKCIGCGKCATACKLENGVPMREDHFRTWIERYVFTEEGQVFVDSPDGGINGFAASPLNVKYAGLDIRKSFFVPKLCNQCDNPPCVRVCPVGATYMTKDGVVLIDRGHCIGCGYCIQACPYGARYLHHDIGVADKCNWCYHRISKGLPPACVEVCPVGARVFGSITDPDSPVRKLIRDERVDVLKPSLGTEPKVYYAGLEKGVV